jgi:hypothetical protein
VLQPFAVDVIFIPLYKRDSIYEPFALFAHILSLVTIRPMSQDVHIGLPCLACRCAAIVFHNPFQKRFYQQLEHWLN